MRKMMYLIIFLFTIFILAATGCKKEENSNNNLLLLLAMSPSGTYGGTSPVGDFIDVTLDRINKTVIHTNYTTGAVNGPYTYAALSAANAYGFSILNRLEIGSGNYVLFSEFPGAALVYQVFNANGTSSGWPVYVVSKSATGVSVYYSTAFNWLKFYIDQASTGSDMECGFAAYDDSSSLGLMYGAGYSNNREIANPANAIMNVNASGTMKLNSLVYDAAKKAYIYYDPSHTGDMTYAMCLSGTSSGTVVLDFGSHMGGGGGLAIPQASTKALQPAYVGTYFTAVYENRKGVTATKTVQPMKVVITSDSRVKVFTINDNTATGTWIYNESLQAVEDFTSGPVTNETVTQTFNRVAGNASAISTVVKNAHLCHGSFTSFTTGGNTLLMIAFDPSGRFLGFTMLDKNGTSGDATNDIIRFGFGIKDANYTNL